MFSHDYKATWQEVSELQQASHTDSVSWHRESLASSLPALVNLLWADEFSGETSQNLTIREQSSATKEKYFGGCVYAIAPIYVTSICKEQCVYCNYRAGNKGVNVERLRLSDADLAQEAEYLIDRKNLSLLWPKSCAILQRFFRTRPFQPVLTRVNGMFEKGPTGHSLAVIPAQAGIQRKDQPSWIPAFAGMTKR